MSNAFNAFLGVLIRVNIVFVALAMCVSDLFIHVVYTDKWLPMAPIFQILSLAMLVNAYTLTFRNLMINTGKSKEVSHINLIILVTLAILIIPSLYYMDIIGVSIAIFLANLSGLILAIIRSKKQIIPLCQDTCPLSNLSIQTKAGGGK